MILKIIIKHMTILNLSFDGYDFKQIAEAVSAIRVAGHSLGLIGILISYFTLYMPFKNAPQCIAYKNLPCDIPKYIFFIFAGIYASGLIGLPWDVLVILTSWSLPDNSPILRETSFQVAVFGFLALNIWLILSADTVVKAIIIFQLIVRNMISADPGWNAGDYFSIELRFIVADLRYVLRNAVIYSFIADFVLIPQFV